MTCYGMQPWILHILYIHAWVYFSSLSDADAAHFNITAAEKANFMEEVTTELSVYLGMLYHMVEVFKGHDDFADELSSYIGFSQVTEC